MGAPLPPVPNTIQVVVSGLNGAERWANRFFYTYSGAVPTVAALAALAGGFQTSWASQVAPLCAPAVNLTEVLLTDLNSNTGNQGANTVSIVGTRTGGIIGANSAVLLSYPSSTRYRGGHARTYVLAGVTTDLLNSFTWNGAFVTAVTTNFGNFLAAQYGQSSGGTTLVSQATVRRHGRFLLNNGPPHYVLTNPIVTPIPMRSFITQAELASQKGRIGRRSK